MDAWLKNLWLLLTIALPGATTYGTFRLMLVFCGGGYIDKTAFEKIDQSALLTTCMILALGVLQQAISIPLEPLLRSYFCRHRRKYNRYYLLFCERFKYAASGQMSEEATRIMGNFFTSVNVIVGQCLIILYLVGFTPKLNLAAITVISAVAAVGVVSAAYRLQNAASVVDIAADVPKQEPRKLEKVA